MKLESSEGMVPELLTMTTCFKDGTMVEGVDNDRAGTMCLSRGICDREISLGVVMKTFVSTHQLRWKKTDGPTVRSANSSSSSLYAGLITARIAPIFAAAKNV